MGMAPATIAIILAGLGSIVGLCVWLRTTLLQLRQSQAQTTYFALHDALTGAANRVLFDRKLEEAAGFEHLAKTKVLLVAIDLDHFKVVNDTSGHAAGDRLLKDVARRLMFELPEEATLGRFGGDEFLIVQAGIVGEGQAHWICQRLLQIFDQPFQIEKSPNSITASIGFALEDSASIAPEEMLRRADVALYAAKAEGRNRLKSYDPAMDQSRREKRMLEIQLRNALLNGTELQVHYQPIFHAASGDIAGAEALIRWKHPERGSIPPDQFIGLAEETGLIDQLGRFVLREACRVAVTNDLPWIAVNLSPVQLSDPDLAHKILSDLAREGLLPSRLELEITEGVLLQNSPVAQQTLSALREAGVHIALDDFGTGYSSISYLRTYTVDKLKIDRSFVRLVNEDRTVERIVKSIVDLADALGMSVTAEGVEEEPQRRILASLGCTHLQGYLLSRPVPEPELSRLLHEQLAIEAKNAVA
jgi:diguanylate cyclase (GGDEF)-like protein